MIEVEGHKLAALAFNEDAPGTPVVLIHGVIASVNFWHPEYLPWLAGRRWYSLGLPAHYPSRAPADFRNQTVDDALFARLFSGALEQLVGDEPALVVGHSTGGFAALNLAAREPERFRAIASVGGFAVGRFGGLEGLLQRFAVLGPIGRWLFRSALWQSTRFAALTRWMSVPLAARWGDYLRWPGLKPTFARLFPDTQCWDRAAMCHLFQGIYRLDIRALLPQVNVPVLVIAGERDPVIPFANAQAMARALPNAQFKPLPGIGHMPFAECPEDYTALMTDWLARHNQESKQ